MAGNRALAGAGVVTNTSIPTYWPVKAGLYPSAVALGSKLPDDRTVPVLSPKSVKCCMWLCRDSC